MNCEQARELWHDRCDGLLESAEEASLAVHLRSCPACSRYHRQMDRMERAFSVLREASESVGVSDKEWAGSLSADPASVRGRRRIPLWHLGRVAAAVALLVGAGVFVSQYDHRRGSAPGPLGGATPVPAAAAGQEPVAPTEIVLAKASDAEFIAVHRETPEPRVHVFWLYRTGERPASMVRWPSIRQGA